MKSLPKILSNKLEVYTECTRVSGNIHNVITGESIAANNAAISSSRRLQHDVLTTAGSGTGSGTGFTYSKAQGATISIGGWCYSSEAPAVRGNVSDAYAMPFATVNNIGTATPSLRFCWNYENSAADIRAWQLFFAGGPVTSFQYPSQFAANTPVHTVCTYDNANVRLYQNGVLVKVTAETRQLLSTVGFFLTPTSFANKDNFAGHRTGAFVTSQVLTDQEIELLYNSNFIV